MSLLSNLPEEVVEDIAVIIHESICESHDDDMDEGDEEECLSDDMTAAREILGRLEEAGVTYSPIFIPMKGQDDETPTSEARSISRYSTSVCSTHLRH